MGKNDAIARTGYAPNAVGELETALSLKEEHFLKAEQEVCELKESLGATKQQLTQYISQLDQTQGLLEANDASGLRIIIAF